ncbi:hypothetical protein [Alkalimonas amylolytica]|uniref:Uncharacterized protein n=1 Tax=Alkalimonas amylolytica TaxID=152573 RepID=A0A1H4EJ74_ALKAM|nr:hypothetical protein [Alkalimonas amylolytica]SEA84630.1 hypothetical protein SAMN04488051_10745 [Alkalimonas amylolytica]
MAVYRLKPVENSIEVLDLSLLQFADILGDEDYVLIRSQPRTNESLSARWKHTECKLAPFYQKGQSIPDISYWGSYLVMTKQAYSVFQEPLSREGEFLPLSVSNKPMYIYIPLTFGQEDKTRTVKHFEDGYECGLEQLVFDKTDVSKKWIFKSAMYGFHALFVSEAFKELFEQSGFSGVIFDSDLAGAF